LPRIARFPIQLSGDFGLQQSFANLTNSPAQTKSAALRVRHQMSGEYGARSDANKRGEWNGVLVPHGTPRAIVGAFNGAINRRFPDGRCGTR